MLDVNKINEDYLLLLLESNKTIETSTVSIENHFKSETIQLFKLCIGEQDNINEIINFIRNSIKPKIPIKVFNYCIKLDEAYQSVYVNIEAGILDISNSRDLIYKEQSEPISKKIEFNLEEQFRKLKEQINKRIDVWFKAFNIEFAYERAKEVPNMLVYSHRMSGWSFPVYKITESLKQQIKTNFGYGNVSYFYCLLIFKNIQITPLSEWIDYQYANFSEVTRYTKSFRRNANGKLKIENSYWYYAIEFTKNAANLSLTNEKEFIKHYIIDECEKMVEGLENFYRESEFEFVDEEKGNIENQDALKKRVDYNGYELIDFRTEKIVGALDFIAKIIEYNSVISTNEYIDKIISLNKKFIPNVYSALENQKAELIKANRDYNEFIKVYNPLVKKYNSYLKYKERDKDEFSEFLKTFRIYEKELLNHKHKIKLHSGNITKLTGYINKYKEIVKDQIHTIA